MAAMASADALCCLVFFAGEHCVASLLPAVEGLARASFDVDWGEEVDKKMGMFRFGGRGSNTSRFPTNGYSTSSWSWVFTEGSSATDILAAARVQE